ncbi:MAG: hypothetical protein HRF49_03995 [bacterium]|jgi:curli biogenesis system outer membrane secretion channel CsgG
MKQTQTASRLAAAVGGALLAALLPATQAFGDVTKEKWARAWPITQISVTGYFSPDIKRIAVMPFTVAGDDKAMAESLMNKLIAEIAREGVLETISRSELERILGEQRFQQSGFADAASIKEMGRLLGVDALVIGSASDLSSKTERHEEDAVDYYKEEQKEKKVWNKEKQAYETKYETVKIPVYKKVQVVEQWSHASLEAKLVGIETGQVLHACTGSGDFSNRNYAGQGTTYSEGEMLSWAVDKAMDQLAKEITPFKETYISYLFCHSGDFVSKEFADAWALAVGGDLEGALAGFRNAYRPDKIKKEKIYYIAWNECLMLASLERWAEFDAALAEFKKEFAGILSKERGLAANADGLGAFLARNFERRHGAFLAGSMKIAAVDGADYYVAVPVGLKLYKGNRLAVVETKTIYNELTGEVLTTKESTVAELQVIETGEGFALCILVSGAAKVGDAVRVV